MMTNIAQQMKAGLVLDPSKCSIRQKKM